MNRHTDKTTVAPGFTLVELLVVIAIVGLLVATLLPALGQTKEVARTVKCLSQERQSGVAMFAYVSDFNEYWLTGSYPFCGLYPNHYVALWSAVVAHYSSFTYITEDKTNFDVYPIEAKFTSYGELKKPTNHILKCPSENSKNTWGGPTSVSYGYNGTVYGMGVSDHFTDSDDMAFHYGVNGPIYKAYYGRVRTPQIIKSSGTVLIADEYAPGGYEYSGYHLSWTSPDYRHAGGVTNVLWTDGHATSKKRGELVASDYDRR